MQDLHVERGRLVAYTVELRRADGSAVPADTYDGTEPLSLEVWPGGGLAAKTLADSLVEWLDAPASPPTVTVTYGAADTATFHTGDLAAVVLTDGGSIEAYRHRLIVARTAASDIASAGYTRAKVERRLLGLYRGWLRRAGLDYLTESGGNESLDAPLLLALESCGVEPVDPGYLGDGDLSTLAVADRGKFFALARLATLDAIEGNWSQANQQQGADRQDLGDLLGAVQAARKALATEIKAAGWDAPPSAASGWSAGSISLGYQEPPVSGW